MKIPENIIEIKSLDDLQKETYLIFKDSNSCPISARARVEVYQFAREHPDITVYQNTVQLSQQLKNDIANHFNVEHESPQILAIDHGKVKTHFSHGAITKEALENIYS